MSQDKLKPIHWARAKAQSLRSCTAWCRLSRWSRALRSCRFLSRALGPTDVDWLGFVRIIWKLLSFIMLVLNMLHIYIFLYTIPIWGIASSEPHSCGYCCFLFKIGIVSRGCRLLPTDSYSSAAIAGVMEYDHWTPIGGA